MDFVRSYFLMNKTLGSWTYLSSLLGGFAVAPTQKCSTAQSFIRKEATSYKICILKGHFKINWPLENVYICIRNVSLQKNKMWLKKSIHRIKMRFQISFHLVKEALHLFVFSMNETLLSKLQFFNQCDGKK